VPASATSTPDNLGNDVLARLIRGTRVQRRYARQLEDARREQVTRWYRTVMTYYHMALWEWGMRRAREERVAEEERIAEEERRRAAAAQAPQLLDLEGMISRLKIATKNARTMAERTGYQQQLEMCLQMKKGR
ncbi:MAG: hypothetical protein LQ337_008963, partial [Flavoplaca oasis]